MLQTLVRTAPVELAAEFDVTPGYLAAASNGILPRRAIAAMVADLQCSGREGVAPARYDQVIADTRAAYASLVGMPPECVALGSQTATLVAEVAAALPTGADVLVAADEFTSVVLPFAVGSRLCVRTVPLAELAEAIRPTTALVAFSLVQSNTGEVVAADRIVEAARRSHTRTLVDLTQAAGVLPVRAADFDITVCHAYKWLCTPRGVAFMTVRPDAFGAVLPVGAGWYSSDDPWANCYWPRRAGATTARRFDTSPAWQAFVGARESVRLFAGADLDAVWAHCARLGDRLCRGMGIPEQHRAVVSWPDPSHEQLARLAAAGVRASGPQSLLRVAFHVWNTEADVDAALAALGR